MTGPDDLGGDAWLDRRAPFGSVFAPAVRASTQRIGLAADTLLHPRAVAELQAALLGRLCSLAADGLLVVFRDRLATAGVSPDVTDSAADGRYRRFVTATARDLGHVSDDLPVLGDLVELVRAQWEARTRELIDRLAADEGVLRAAFDAPTGALVSDIDCFLGDPHRNGASVVRLAHDTGATWYHKPRSVDHEADFSATIGALSRHFGGPAPTMAVIARNGHGWMGALEAGTPPDPEQYWRNAGRVAALTHMIGAVDLHHENVVATTWGPIPVDLECVHQPIIWSDEPEPTHLDAPRLLDTVCATGLLPNHYQESSPVALELCGLLARPNQSGGEWRTEWTGLGTDAIATTRRLSTWGSAPNRPVDHDGRLMPALVEELVRGFEEGLDHLTGPGAELVADRGRPSRVLLRETMTYVDQLGALSAPEALADHREFDRRCAGLPPFPPVVVDQLGTGIAAIDRAEHEALRRLDVPLHHVEDTTLVLDDGVRLARVVRTPSSVRHAHRLRTSTGAAGAAQAALVRLAAEQHEGATPHLQPSSDRTTSDADLLDAACAIGERLAAERLGPAEDPSWLEARGPARRRRGVIGDPSWYDGRTGIAVFFATLAAATGDAAWAGHARRALPDAIDAGPWFDIGNAGLAYARTLVGVLCDDPELTDGAAKDLSAADDVPTRGDELDLMNGWAGVLACHAAVFAQRPTRALAERITSISDGFVAEFDRQRRDPIDQRGLLRTGTAHGVTGIAHALLMLTARGAATEEVVSLGKELRELDLERTRDRDGLAGRLDGTGARRRIIRTWCWGATGVLHAWAGTCADDPRARQSVDACLPELVAPWGDAAHLCCGEAGRAVALMTIGRSWQRPEAVHHARVLAAHLASQATDGERFWILPDCTFQGTGLMYGRAGIGYALCRVAAPAVVPDILGFETRPPAVSRPGRITRSSSTSTSPTSPGSSATNPVGW